MPLSSVRLLDDIYRLAQVEAFASDAFLQQLADELAALPSTTVDEVGAPFDALAALFDDVERFCQRVMGLWMAQSPRLSTVPGPLRTLVTSTVTSYAGKTSLLQERVHAALQRHDRNSADAITMHLLQAAESVLATRLELCEGALMLARKLAEAQLTAVERRAANRLQASEERDRWLRTREDLRQVMADPPRILKARFAERLKTMEPPPDVPEPESGVHPTSLLEVD